MTGEVSSKRWVTIEQRENWGESKKVRKGNKCKCAYGNPRKQLVENGQKRRRRGSKRAAHSQASKPGSRQMMKGQAAAGDGKLWADRSC